MIRHTNYSLVTYFESVGVDVQTESAVLFDFVYKMLKVDYHAGSHYTYGFIAGNSGRKKVKDECTLFVYDGVTRVVSSLVSYYYVIA